MCSTLCLCSIGNVLGNQGKPEAALAMYQKSLDTKLKVFGPDHPDAADTLYNIALLHRELGQHDLEAECFEKCVIIYAAVYGDADADWQYG